MEIFVTTEFTKRFNDLPKSIQRKAEKQEKIFRENPFHSSLHTEKLNPKARAVWSFRLDKKYRVVFRFENKDKITFLTVGHHNWIYKIEIY